MKTPKSRYKIWDDNMQVPAYCRKPSDPRAEKLGMITLQEQKLGIKYYIPARKLRQ